MADLSFSYSPWFLMLCTVLAGVLSWWLYRRPRVALGPWLRRGLVALRFLALFILFVLFLEPLWTAVTEERRPPVVTILQDNSQSLAASRDSSFLRGPYREQLGQLRKALEAEGAAVQTYAFGKKAGRLGELDSLRYQETASDPAGALQQAARDFANQNLGAVVLASDGIPTAGAAPANAVDKLSVPVYTALLGDTTPRRDLLIQDLTYNELSYVNTETPVQVDVRGQKIEPGRVRLRLRDGDKVLASKQLKISARRGFSAKHTFYITLEEPGLQQFQVDVERLDGELTYRNNQRSFFINVLENRLKIALFAGGPHPDIGALRSTFADERYEFTPFIRKSATTWYQPPPEQLEEYDLFILHNFPAVQNDRGVLKRMLARASEANTPMMHLVGQQTNFRILPELKEYMALTPDRANAGATEAFLYLTGAYEQHASFRFSADRAAFNTWLETAPPLLRNEAQWEAAPGATVYGKAKIKGIALQYPMFALAERNGYKTMTLVGENLWRYRVHAYTVAENFKFFDEWIQNLAQWLTVRADKRRFKVTPAEQLFTGSEPVRFSGQAYDEAYEPLEGVEIKLTITNPESKTLNYYLQENQPGAYGLKLNNLAEGTYNYQATGTKDGKEIGTDRGEFSVGRSAVEFIELQADAGQMRQVALRTGGQMYGGRQLEQLAQAVLQAETMKPVVALHRSTQALHRFLWPLVVVIALLTIEWVLRKRNGLI